MCKEQKLECPRLDFFTEFLKMKGNLDRIFSPITQKYGLTPVLSIILNMIEKYEKPTVSSVFKSLDLNQGNVSSMCKKLEKDGFITREKDKSDERIIKLIITQKGHDAINGIHFEMSKINNFHNYITDDDIKAARQGLTALSDLSSKISLAISEIDP